MSCRPEKEKFLKGEYDIELKYDNWAQQQKMYGQQDFVPKYSSFTEAMKASQELEEGY